ncbi:MAG: glycoside hydrolase family 16 protein [Coriobacteriia bacterium]|nr:glycoside hydrolase family 16 protein [Coriobacteriia bacterium]
MARFIRRLLVVLVLAFALCAIALRVQPAAATPSTLVFSDEFSGSLNTASWSKLTPWSTRYTTGELEYYDPANATLVNGNLRLTSEKRATNGYAYASGILTSLPHQKFSYGYFEMRAQLPKGQGIWPAFWLTNDSTLEIDCMEMLGNAPGTIYMTYHKNGVGVAQSVYNGVDFSLAFHTFAVDWQPTYIKYYIDGVLAGSYTGTIPSDPMWICVNTAIGGTWGGLPDASTAFPAYYDIDYIRVYTSKPAAVTEPVPSPEPTATPTTPSPVTPTPALPGTIKVKKPVYRFYDKQNGSHFYTVSAAERDQVITTYSDTYTYEGSAFNVSASDSVDSQPVYRFYNKQNGSHFYTVSAAERDQVITTYSDTYTYEGSAFNVSTSSVDSQPVYRFYDKQNGSHFYTVSAAERDQVITTYSDTYTYEGSAFWVGK